MLRNRALVLLLALGVLACPVSAQQLPAQDDLYHVEIIVFSRAVPPEIHYRHPGEPGVSGAIDILAVAPTVADQPLQREIGVHFWPVPLSNLEQVRDKLVRLGAYRVLVDLAWEQTAVVFGESRPVHIYGGEVLVETEPTITLIGQPRRGGVTEVNGTAALERGRFVHLELDVAFHRPQSAHDTGVPLTVVHGPFDTQQPYQTHRITERRQMELGRIQYFDHEQFGVLALVEKVEPANASERSF